MKIFAYARESPDMSERFPLALQVEQLNNWFVSLPKTKPSTMEIYKEYAAGSSFNGRLVWSSIIDEIKSGDTIVVTTLSRICRNVKELTTFLDVIRAKNVNLVVLDMKFDSASVQDNFMYNILAAMLDYTHNFKQASNQAVREFKSR